MVGSRWFTRSMVVALLIGGTCGVWSGSVAHAATGNIYPAFHAFMYPASVVGKPFYWQLGGGGGPYTPPADDRYYGSNSDGPKNSYSQTIVFDAFEYRVKPLGVYGGSPDNTYPVALYTVTIFNSPDDAQRTNTVDRSNNRTTEGGALMPLIPLAHPALPNEWARMNSGGTTCYVTTGLTFHNLLLEATVISENGREGGQPNCTNEVRYVEKVEHLMVATAAQVPPDA